MFPVVQPPKIGTPDYNLWLQVNSAVAGVGGINPTWLAIRRLYDTVQKLVADADTTEKAAKLFGFFAQYGYTPESIQELAVHTKVFLNAIKPGTINDSVPPPAK
jgi:hypothetical protein